MIGVIYILTWLISNRVVKILCNNDKEGFVYIQKYYYWFQYCLFAIAILTTPKYSTNDALFFLLIYISLKLIIDRITIIDIFINKYIKK